MHSITPTQLAIKFHKVTILDVRKPNARAKSGHYLTGSSFRHPFDAANWAQTYRGHQLVIYCVHGHAVSQSVCGYLRDEGLDCCYVEGGLEALIDAGFETSALARAEAGDA
ncbi:MAG: rhodanese-like domain-containing protein [Pseudomonadota bacterium]